MRHELIFGGLNSSDFGVWISGEGTYNAPERSYESISVPGRNGDLIIDNGKWNNIVVTYPAYIEAGFKDKFADFRAAFCRLTGYQTLEDTYHPDEYRMGMFINGLTVEPGQFSRDGRFEISFNCKPQRFLKSGTVPAQYMYVILSGDDWITPYIPVDGDLSFTATTSSSLDVTLYTYNSSGTQLTSTAYTCADGVKKTKTFSSSDKYWQIKIANMSIDDDDYLTVVGSTTYGVDTIALNVKVGLNFWLDNPTKYPAAPLIEFYGTHLPQCGIVNYENGVDGTGWSFHSSDMAGGKTHGFFDSELQYLYDSSLKNQTNTLTMTQSGVYNPFTFPVLEGDKTNFYCYETTDQPISAGIGLILLYPRWWRL